VVAPLKDRERSLSEIKLGLLFGLFLSCNQKTPFPTFKKILSAIFYYRNC